MNSAFLDTNNHVPEITQGDDWDDVDGQKTVEFQPGPSLPRWRSAADKGSFTPENIETGQRIGSAIGGDQPGSNTRKLEIPEIPGAVIRLEQGLPAVPKIERIVKFREKPESLKDTRSGEGQEWGQVTRSSNRWIVSMGIAILAIIVFGITILPKINAPNTVREVPLVMPVTADDEMPEGIVALNELVARPDEAMSIFRSFVHATNPEQVVPLIRKGKGMEAQLRKSWVPKRLPRSWEAAADSSWMAMNLAGRPCGLLEGDFPDHTKFRAYFIDDHGHLVLDWPATAAYGTATFNELAAGKGNGSGIRGIISMGDYYTSAFPELKYQSFRFVSANDEITIWCYVARDNPTSKNLMSRLQPSLITQEAQEPEKITLRLERGSAEAMPNQWLIADLLHFEWLSP